MTNIFDLDRDKKQGMPETVADKSFEGRENATNSSSSSGNSVLQFKIFNPLVNALLSTNDPSKSALKDIYASLLEDQFSYAFIIPSAHCLLNYYNGDQSGSSSFRELCAKPEFLKDHILDLRNSNNVVTKNMNKASVLNTRKGKIFKTASGKDLMLKKDMIILPESTSNKGNNNFGATSEKRPQSNSASLNQKPEDNLRKIRVDKIELFQNFNQNLGRNSEFLFIHIDEPLSTNVVFEMLYKKANMPTPFLFGISGNPVSPARTPTHSRSSSLHVKSPILRSESEKFSKDAAESLVAQDDLTKPKVTFTQLIGRFPLIKEKVGEEFQHLFNSFVIESINEPSEILTLYKETVNQSALIFKTLHENIIDSILDFDPTIDLNRCMYDYVELNLYDKLWSQLKQTINYKTVQKSNVCTLIDSSVYEDLQDVSITQVGVFDSEYFYSSSKRQRNVMVLLRRIDTGVRIFKNMTLANNYLDKSKVLLDTITALTEGSIFDEETQSDIDVNADMLVALLILVVIRSKVEDLHAHLEYIKNFSYFDIDTGLLGYSLSTFEAVVFHLEQKTNLNTLLRFSKENREVRQLIFDKDLAALTNYLQSVMDQNDHKISSDHSLKCLTKEGESILALSIRYANYETFKTIFDFETLFPIEDILYDFDINNVTLLNLSVILGKRLIRDEITSVILSSCDIIEILEYFNIQDQHKRHIGHYFYYDINFIKKVGYYIDWRCKDINCHTPLISICRNYDIANYEEIVSTVFEIVLEWYKFQGKVFDYFDHIDNKGNTILHILKNGIQYVLKHGCVDVNELNFKNYSPLSMSIKYNRMENVKHLLENDRLYIEKTDPKTFLTILDFVKITTLDDKTLANNNDSNNQDIEKLIDNYFLSNYVPLVEQKKFGILRAKLDSNQWAFIIKGVIFKQIENHKLKVHRYSNYHTLTDFKELIRLLHIEFPVCYLPISYIMDNLQKLNFSQFAYFNFNKLKINELIVKTNIFMTALLLSKDFNNHELVWEFLILPEIDPLKLESRSRLKMDSQKEKLTINYQISDSPIFNSPNIPEEFADNDIENLQELFLLDESKNYQPEEVEEISIFFKYASNEIGAFVKSFKKIVQFAILNKHKVADLKDSFMLNSMFIDDIDKRNANYELSPFDMNWMPFKKLVQIFKKISEDQEPLKKLIFYLQFLSISCERLDKNVKSVVNRKILKWLKLHEETKNIKSELIRLRPNDFTPLNNNGPKNVGKDNESITDVSTVLPKPDDSPLNDSDTLNSTLSNFNVFEHSEPPSRASSASTVLRTPEVQKKSSFLSNLIQSRKTSHELKVIKQYKINRLKLISLSNDVKFHHESLATEISNFFEFKKLFLKYAIKTFVKDEIRSLKCDANMIEGGLHRA